MRHDLRALTVEEVAFLKAPDRQKVLEEGAKKEGKLLWYSTLIVNQALRPIKEAFEKKYPFVQIDYYRADSDQIAQKIITEYQAKRFDVDTMDGTSTIVLIKKAGFLQRFFSSQLNDYPANLKGADGYWAVPNVYFMTLGYNTDLIKPNDVPRSMNDLLNPKWKRKMIWSTSGGSGAPIFIGNTLMTIGQEKGMAYLRSLVQQDIAKSTASNRAVLDMVIAGEAEFTEFGFMLSQWTGFQHDKTPGRRHAALSAARVEARSIYSASACVHAADRLPYI